MMHEKKNLFLIAYDYPYGVGETFLEEEIKHLSKAFEQIYIVSLSQSLELTRSVPENVNVIKCDRRYHPVVCVLYSLCKFFSLEFWNEYFTTRSIDFSPTFMQLARGCFRAWCIKKRIDLAVENNRIDCSKAVAYSYWLAEGAYYIAKNSPKWALAISRAHGYEIRDYEGFIPFRVTIDESLNAIYFISEHTKNEYERILSRYKKKSPKAAVRKIIHLGVKQPELLRGKQNAEDLFLLVSVSSIYPLKRLDIIVDVLARYTGDKKIRWVHFGWGNLGPEIKKLCEDKLAGKTNVEYVFAGQVENEKVLHFYENHSVSLFINTSDSEGLPVSIMEAMSYGIPCMARDVGGNAEIVKNNLSGYLIDKNADASEMAQKIERIVAGNDFLSSEQIKKWSRENYNSESNYDFFVSQVLDSVRD